jgi:uncharacterized protein YjaG (DUF416 family)
MTSPVDSETVTNDLDKIIEVEDETDINEAVAAIDAAVAAAEMVDTYEATTDDPNSGVAVTSKDKRKRSEV